MIAGIVCNLLIKRWFEAILKALEKREFFGSRLWIDQPVKFVQSPRCKVEAGHEDHGGKDTATERGNSPPDRPDLGWLPNYPFFADRQHY